MFRFWLLLICMTQKFYFVCSAYEKYELSSNCIAIIICSIYLRNLESICCKWRDRTTNFWFFTRFPWQIWQHDCHIFQSSISLNFKKDVIFDKSSFRRCNFVYSNIVSYNLKEKWKIYVVQCSFRQARRKRGAVAPPVFSRTVNPISTRGSRLFPPQYYEPPWIFRPCDGPA